MIENRFDHQRLLDRITDPAMNFDKQFPRRLLPRFLSLLSRRRWDASRLAFGSNLNRDCWLLTQIR